MSGHKDKHIDSLMDFLRKMDGELFTTFLYILFDIRL